MNTPREPLMLSDTAMVLLRQYIEVVDDETALHSGWKLYFQDLPEFGDDPPLDAYYALVSRRQQIVAEILLEMSILWTLPDIAIVRNMDWHLILDEHAMSVTEQTFRSRRHQTHRQYNINGDRNFMKALVDAYQESVSARAQTKTTP